MKKLFLVIGLMTSVIFCNAQSTYEPEFIGETNLLCISGSDTISMALDKRNAKIKSKAGASLYLNRNWFCKNSYSCRREYFFLCCKTGLCL